MTDTQIQLDDRLGTPINVIPCPADMSSLDAPEHQREMRRVFETPGIVVVDNVLDEHILAGLREGLSDERRKFKDKFNKGLPETASFKQAYKGAIARITDLTRHLFGYELPDKGNRSYRPLVTADEPLHFDTYTIECGKTPLMSVFNFDTRPRIWNVGPSFSDVCRDHPDDISAMLGRLAPGESLSMRIRDEGQQGIGPLREGAAVHRIQFAPGAVWYANPKTTSHQIVYGGGAQFETWTIEGPDCSCPRCAINGLWPAFQTTAMPEIMAALR